MSTETSAPCVPHAVAIVEFTRIARESGRCDDFVNLAQFCATEPVVAVLRHAAAMVRGTSATDEWLDYSASQIVPAVVRAVGVCNGALFGVFGRDENRLIAAIAETEALMEGHEGAALLAGDLRRVLEVLNTGLASPEHESFVAQLQTRRVAR